MSSTDELLQQARDEARSGRREAARAILARIVRQEPEHIRAWYLLSQVVDSDEQVRFCLNKVLNLDPAHEKARLRLQALDAPPPAPVVALAPQNDPPDSVGIAPEWRTPNTTSSAPAGDLNYSGSRGGKYKMPKVEHKEKPDRFSLWFVLAMVGILMVVCCCGGWILVTTYDWASVLGLESNLPQMDTGSGGPNPFVPVQIEPKSKYQVTYRLEGTAGKAVTIAYYDAGGHVRRINSHLPWSKTLTFGAEDKLLLSAQLRTGSGQLICSIDVDGGKVREAEANGTEAAVFCLQALP